MQFASSVSQDPDGYRAAADLVRGVQGGLPGAADLALLFVTADHVLQFRRMAELVREELAPRVLLGCTAESVLGVDREIEREPGASLLVGHLPGVQLHAFAIDMDEWSAMLADSACLRNRLGTRPDTRAYLVLGDPLTTPVREALAAFDATHVPAVGGMASGAPSMGHNVLVLDDEVVTTGLVGVTLSGDVRVETVLSQGCRPVGPVLDVTEGQRNVIMELDGQPALSVAQRILRGLPAEEQVLLQNGIFIGLAADEAVLRGSSRDFAVDQVTGVDERVGALGISMPVQNGQRVRFHVRDAASADEDLRILLATRRLFERPPAGALLFTCAGRGTRMFSEPDHDVACLRAAMPAVPVAGFFASGEISPVGGRSGIHGHAASMALFHPLEAQPTEQP